MGMEWGWSIQKRFLHLHFPFCSGPTHTSPLALTNRFPLSVCRMAAGCAAVLLRAILASLVRKRRYTHVRRCVLLRSLIRGHSPPTKDRRLTPNQRYIIQFSKITAGNKVPARPGAISLTVSGLHREKTESIKYCHGDSTYFASC